MIVKKHDEISAILRKNIKRNIYTKKLPSVRQLAEDFEVSTSTINKALKTLANSGLIVSDGPRGIYINDNDSVRAKTSIVAIFTGGGSPDPQSDPLLRRLSSQIEQSGHVPLFLTASSHKALNDPFWSSNYVDGYIFVYSSFDSDFARKLQEAKVPFVLGNRFTLNKSFFWADFDLEGTMRKVLDILLKIKRTDIIYANHESGSGELAKYPKMLWDNICLEHLNQCSGTYLGIEPTTVENASQIVAKRFACSYPQANALILEGALDLNIIEKYLLDKGLKINEDYSLFVCNSDETYHYNQNDNYNCIIHDYSKLATAIWQLFLKSVDINYVGAEQTLIDCQIYCNFYHKELLKRSST